MTQLAIFLHTIEGRPVLFRIGKDRISAPRKNKPVVVEIHGKRYEVNETKKQIEALMREARWFA